MRLLVVTTVLVAALVAVWTGSASAVTGNGQVTRGDVIIGVPATARTLPVQGLEAALGARSVGAGATAAATPAVGTVRPWVALDDFQGFLYLKPFTLRGVGEHSEVWVANDTNFPVGDCRNGVRTEITDQQVAYFVDQFESNIYPKESEAFSVAPPRDGSNSLLPLDFTGEGDNIVILIDNVRDQNYYDLQASPTYIAGFFHPAFTIYNDRNVMTIDAFDWLHRTGATPPDEPVPGDLCNSAPARPFLYEGVFAHEYQHLLEGDEDPDEQSWVNEGLADWAQTLTGYVVPATPITESGFDGHIQCFLGWGEVQTPVNPNPRKGGPENSLTLWGDQGDGEILCDYGAAYTLMELLAGRYGTGFMSELHRNDANGLEGLQAVLDGAGAGTDAMSVLHDWNLAVALDGLLDDGAKLRGADAGALSVPTLDATINWKNDDAYESPGAPPNGSDYIRLMRDDNDWAQTPTIGRLAFDGAERLPSLPLEWTVDATPPADSAGLVCGAAPPATVANAALYSGCADDLDRSLVYEVTVPDDDPTLRFRTLFSTEVAWDYGFVQVSTDGGATYTSLDDVGDLMGIPPDPAAIAAIQANQPGFTGLSGGWQDVEFDLSAYAGDTVLIAFRYITDPAVTEAGWWVDDVAVGGTAISDGSSLEGGRSATEVYPTPVAGWKVRLIGYREKPLFGGPLRVAVYDLPLDAEFRGTIFLPQLLLRLGLSDFVAAVVTYDDPSETSTQYAPYALTVNRTTQPGGGG
jgi:hypothetical protein